MVLLLEETNRILQLSEADLVKAKLKKQKTKKDIKAKTSKERSDSQSNPTPFFLDCIPKKPQSGRKVTLIKQLAKSKSYLP